VTKPRGSREMQPTSAFTYWKDSSTCMEVTPPMQDKKNSKPFYVLGKSHGHWVPISLIVWAVDAHEAKDRIMYALGECARLDYKGRSGKKISMGYINKNQAHRLLECIKSGELIISVTPIDIEVITKVAWAGNDTVT
jgi:hypothetical protein